MKPRIFVSSTFYDLKPIREDLYHFIRQYNYEPIESEAGDIGYVPGQNLDKSCYTAMKDCDMAILIIGGRYGSAASDETDEDGDYISVTHKEFRTAVENGVPVYAFIEQAVDTEYELYKLNKERFNDPAYEFEFNSVDNRKVFKFISELRGIVGIPILAFSKTQDIKDYLSIQWADMFKKYLQILKEKKADEKIKNSVEDMNILVQKMNLMLDSVGKKILSADNSKEYENVIEMQNVVSVCQKISRGINLEYASFEDSYAKRKNLVGKLVDALDESMSEDIWGPLSDKKKVHKFFEYFKSKDAEIEAVSLGFTKDKEDIQDIVKNPKTKELLINELVKDKYYAFMVEEDFDIDMEEETNNADI